MIEVSCLLGNSLRGRKSYMLEVGLKRFTPDEMGCLGSEKRVKLSLTQVSGSNNWFSPMEDWFNSQGTKDIILDMFDFEML